MICPDNLQQGKYTVRWPYLPYTVDLVVDRNTAREVNSWQWKGEKRKTYRRRAWPQRGVAMEWTMEGEARTAGRGLCVSQTVTCDGNSVSIQWIRSFDSVHQKVSNLSIQKRLIDFFSLNKVCPVTVLFCLPLIWNDFIKYVVRSNIKMYITISI